MQFRRVAICLVLIAGCSHKCPRHSLNPPATGQGNTILVKDGKGSALVTIRNDSANDLALTMSSGPVTDATTGAEISGAAVSFKRESDGKPIPNASSQPASSQQPAPTTPPTAPPPGAQPPGGAPAPAGDQEKNCRPLNIPPHSSIAVETNLTGLTNIPLARMRIFNQGAEVADFGVVALDDPLNVTIDGLGSTAAVPVAAMRKSSFTFAVRNNSAEFLALNCSVELRDSSTSCGRIVLPPNGSRTVALRLSRCAYRWTDWVQPSAQSAGLRLALDVPPGTPPEIAPVKILPLNLTLQGAGPLMEPIASTIYVGLFLLIGGLFSILASSVLPTLVKKAELRKQVDDLANRTSSVSQKVDSYLRVLLRLERKKIQVQLDSVRGLSFSTSAADQFTDISNAIAGLNKRLVVAERLDELRRQFEAKSATAPPSITDSIDNYLNTAAGQLHSFVIIDADVDIANGYLDQAQARLKLLEDNDAQARLIAQNFVQLQNRLKAFPRAYYQDLCRALRGIFESLGFACDDQAGNGPGPAQNPAPPGGGAPANGGKTPDDGTAAKTPDAADSENKANGADAENAANAADAAHADDSAASVTAGDHGKAAAHNPADPGANPDPVAPENQPEPADQPAPENQAPANPAEDAPAAARDTQNPDPPKTDASNGTAPAGAGNGSGGGKDPSAGPAGPPRDGRNPRDFSDPKNIFPHMFFAIDHGIAAIQTTLDYAIVRASVATGASTNCPKPGENAFKRLKEHECELLALLGTLSWKSLRAATTLVQQMREDVYQNDIEKHFKEGKARIVFDTQRARPYLPVFFSIEFVDNRFNGAAALDWINLEWTFPHELYEKGWKVCHYFEGTEGAPEGEKKPDGCFRRLIWYFGRWISSLGRAVASLGKWIRSKVAPGSGDEVHTPAPDGPPSAPPVNPPPHPAPAAIPPGSKRNVPILVKASSPRWSARLDLPQNIEVQREFPRGEKAGVRADRLRFWIAFGVALAALQSGALEQLSKLGFVQATLAIIALGFGADTVKNLLTQSSRPQTTATPAPPAGPKKT